MIKKLYRGICLFEEFITMFFLCAVTLLVFSSAIGRFVGYPLNWATDISLFLFSWSCFLGADVGIRHDRLINVDFLTSKFSLKTQQYVAITWSLVIVAFLIVLIVFGISLSVSNAKRQFQNIAISYSYVTASLPVSASLMIISMGIKLKKQITDFPSTMRSVSKDVA